MWWIDRFGNCQLNVDPDELRARGAAPGGPIEVRAAGSARVARWVGTYADARPSELVLLVDSYGLLSLALDRRSAAEELGLRAGSGVVLVAPSEDGRDHAAPHDAARGGCVVRPGTTIAIVVLLALILGAAVAQFVFRLQF